MFSPNNSNIASLFCLPGLIWVPTVTFLVQPLFVLSGVSRLLDRLRCLEHVTDRRLEAVDIVIDDSLLHKILGAQQAHQSQIAIKDKHNVG